MGESAWKRPSVEALVAEIERLPEHLGGEILEPGLITLVLRPDAPHRRVARECQFSLRDASAVRTGTGWWIEQEPGVRFGEQLFNPDLVGWRVERCPQPPTGYPITIIPDFCCEILSPSTASIDRRTKLPTFARSGVSWVWLIDPESRLVEVFQTQNGKPQLFMSARENETTRFPPFDLEISLAPFWMPTKNPDPSSP